MHLDAKSVKLSFYLVSSNIKNNEARILGSMIHTVSFSAGGTSIWEPSYRASIASDVSVEKRRSISKNADSEETPCFIAYIGGESHEARPYRCRPSPSVSWLPQKIWVPHRQRWNRVPLQPHHRRVQPQHHPPTEQLSRHLFLQIEVLKNKFPLEKSHLYERVTVVGEY